MTMQTPLMPQSAHSGALVRVDAKKKALIYPNSSVIDRVASSLGPAVDKMARRLGWGVENATKGVLDVLVTLSKDTYGKEDRELLLRRLRAASDAEDGVLQLKMACKHLMKYTLSLSSSRKEAAQTQTSAFRKIVTLTTNYPGLRHFFLCFKRLKQVGDTKAEVERLWGRKLAKGSPYRREWKFFYRFAMDCICGITLAASIEKCPIGDMGIVWKEGRSGVLYDLLDEWNACRSDFHEISGLVAMRYLGGILQLSPVWQEVNQRHHQEFIRKLLRRIRNSLEDVGFGREGSLGSTEHVSDIEGIDIVAHAALQGVAIWLRDSPGGEIGTVGWLNEFQKTVELLLTHEANQFLQMSSRLAIDVFAEFMLESPLEASRNGSSQKLHGTKRLRATPRTGAPTRTDLSSLTREEGGLAPETALPEAPSPPSNPDESNLLSHQAKEANTHLNFNGATQEVLDNVPSLAPKEPMQDYITQPTSTVSFVAEAETLPESKDAENDVPMVRTANRARNRHLSAIKPSVQEQVAEILLNNREDDLEHEEPLDTNTPFIPENNATLPTDQYYHTQLAPGPTTSSSSSLFAHPAYPAHSYPPRPPTGVNGLSNSRDFVPSPPDPHPLLRPQQKDPYSSYFGHSTPFTNVHNGNSLHEYSNLSNQIAEQNANSFVSIPMYPAGVPTGPSSPTATTSTSGRSIPVLGSAFLENSFPLETEDHARLREQLSAVMNSEWKLGDQMEPDKDCLLQFIPKDEALKAHVCLFWDDSGPCEKVIKRPQHAKTH
ncbi:hypothetical protein FRC17_003669, partial [Serendipita sp. 399]